MKNEDFWLAELMELLLLGICFHRKYDLKGSTVDREASDKEKGKDLPTLKDNDFLKHGGRIYIGEEAKEKLMETLSADIGVSWCLSLRNVWLFLAVIVFICQGIIYSHEQYYVPELFSPAS